MDKYNLCMDHKKTLESLFIVVINVIPTYFLYLSPTLMSYAAVVVVNSAVILFVISESVHTTCVIFVRQ